MYVADCIVGARMDSADASVSLCGDLGMLEVEPLEQAFGELIAQRPRRVTVDLSKVTLLSSAAMGALLGLHRGLRAQGGELLLRSPERRVLDTLRRVRLHRVFVFDDNVDLA